MKLQSLALVLATLLMSGSALAHGMGNGGDAVVCYTDATRSTITSVKMFDYWEQEQVLNYGAVDLGGPLLSIQDKIEIATKRISKFDPMLGEDIKKMALNLANNIQSYLVTNYELPEIDDANPRAVPTAPNCFIEQYAVQYKDLTTGQRRFSIAAKFYNHANTKNDDRAGIILHEAIYRYAIRMNPALSNSDDVRYFNYIMGSSFLDTLKAEDIQQFHNILTRTKIQQPQCVFKDGIYTSADYRHDQSISCYIQKIKLKPNISVIVTQGTVISSYVLTQDKDKPSSYSPEKGITLEQNGAKPSFVVELVYLGQVKRFLAYKVMVSETDLLIYTSDFTDPNFTSQTINGPGGTDFVCRNALKFDLNSLQIISCAVEKTQVVINSKTYTLNGLIQPLGNDRWLIDPSISWGRTDINFNLLGSKNSVSISPYRNMSSDANTGCTDDLITVDGAYNVVAGCFKNDFPIEVDGKKVAMLNNFEVQNINGEYYLKGQVAYNQNAKGILNPTFKNMKLVKTSKDEKFNYCGTLDFPSKTTWVWGETEQYIGYPGESFYDISTNSVVYKSDENVKVVTRVGCMTTNFVSKNY